MMSLLDNSEARPIRVTERDLAPSVARVDEIDKRLRLRLTELLDYLAGFASLHTRQQSDIAHIIEKLKAGTVSPWVFCLYSKLVAELSKNPEGDVSAIFTDIAKAASLPADEGVVAFRAPSIPTPWWDHFSLLLDTDRQRPFKPQAASHEAFLLCKQDVEAGLGLLRKADPIWHEEILHLLRAIVLAAPRSSRTADVFNGASTFFLWGAVLLNSDLRRSTISIVDLLVHESSHVLLFGISAQGALTHNSGHERYDSPVRKDKRPIEGIFHAAFVSTRVHLAMTRLLRSGVLDEGEAKIAAERAQYNGTAALGALDMLGRHAKPTELGESILGGLRTYWAKVPPN